MRARNFAGLVAAAVLVASSAGRPSISVAQPPQAVRVEWEASQTSRGPVVFGYVYKTYGTAAGRIRLLIEGLDASGQSVIRTTGFVDRPVPALGRTYFEVRVAASTATYRVTVLSVDWRGRDGF